MLDTVSEQFGEQLSEVREGFQVRISEYNANTEYKFNCAVDKIEEISQNFDMYKACLLYTSRCV